ncbi:MAG TPA: histidine kinase [Gaiellaceae bacterium]|nr:histidine kinase [Gaiellaceae bacterium]
MRERVEALVRNRRLQAAGDWALALLLAGTSIGAILAGDDVSWGRTRSLAVVLALATTLPVAWRSRLPLLAAATVLVANGACVYVAAPHEAAFQPFVALTLASYSVGSRFEGPLWVPPALALAAVPLFVLAVEQGQSAGNAIPNYVWLIAAWVVGRAVRSFRRKSTALELANLELAEQRELQAQAAVVVERGRIARELHDVVAHNVSMMVVQAGAAARVLDGEQPHVRNALDAIADTGRQTVDEMRTLLGVLRDEPGTAALKPQPGLGDVAQLVDGMSDAGLPVTLRIEGSPRPLPQAADLSAYRIVQEALTNTLKHAGAASADVVIRYEPGAVALEVRDDGVGHPNGGGTGHGLVGMRERVAMFGGELDAAPQPGGGFAVRARLPLVAT